MWFSDCVSICPSENLGVTTLFPGEQYVIESSGCCNKTVKHCRKAMCPLENVECLPNWVKLMDVATKDQCCPKFICGEKFEYL